MKDALTELGLNGVIDLAIDVHVQLEKGTGTRPILWLLASARERAAQAMRNLVEIDPTDTAKIIILQGQAAAYSDLIDDCRALLNRGKEADRQLDEAARIEIADVLSIDEARDLGLQQTPEDT